MRCTRERSIKSVPPIHPCCSHRHHQAPMRRFDSIISHFNRNQLLLISSTINWCIPRLTGSDPFRSLLLAAATGQKHTQHRDKARLLSIRFTNRYEPPFNTHIHTDTHAKQILASIPLCLRTNPLPTQASIATGMERLFLRQTLRQRSVCRDVRLIGDRVSTGLGGKKIYCDH